MRFDPRTVAGLLIFVAAAQFFVGMLVAESVYPGYSISANYISDLGATCTDTGCVIYQPAATVFNSSVILLGVFAAYRSWGSLVVAVFGGFVLGGLAAIVLLVARRAGRRDLIPFGPALVVGAWVAIAAGEPIVSWYLGL